MSFTLAPLPYAENALEPYVSAETLQYHYGKHHKSYVDKLNAAIKDDAKYAHSSLEEIITSSSGAVFNNAAQIWNHDFYWKSLTPNYTDASDSAFLKAIDKSFGSFEDFKKQFTAKSLTLFGSGWTFLVSDKNKSLSVVQKTNAECPLTDSEYTPLLTCDVWEHAYYIDYRNARPKYLDSYWKVVNWTFAQNNFYSV